MGGEEGLSAEAGWASAFGGGRTPPAWASARRGLRIGAGFPGHRFVWRCPPNRDVTSVYGWVSLCARCRRSRRRPTVPARRGSPSFAALSPAEHQIPSSERDRNTGLRLFCWLDRNAGSGPDMQAMTRHGSGSKARHLSAPSSTRIRHF